MYVCLCLSVCYQAGLLYTGVSVALSTSSNQRGQKALCSVYTAPERRSLPSKCLEESEDIYSFGAVLLELCLGEKLSLTTGVQVSVNKLPTNHPCREIISSSLQMLPERRPRAAQLEEMCKNLRLADQYLDTCVPDLAERIHDMQRQLTGTSRDQVELQMLIEELQLSVCEMKQEHGSISRMVHDAIEQEDTELALAGALRNGMVDASSPANRPASRTHGETTHDSLPSLLRNGEVDRDQSQPSSLGVNTECMPQRRGTQVLPAVTVKMTIVNNGDGDHLSPRESRQPNEMNVKVKQCADSSPEKEAARHLATEAAKTDQYSAREAGSAARVEAAKTDQYSAREAGSAARVEAAKTDQYSATEAGSAARVEAAKTDQYSAREAGSAARVEAAKTDQYSATEAGSAARVEAAKTDQYSAREAGSVARVEAAKTDQYSARDADTSVTGSTPRQDQSSSFKPIQFRSTDSESSATSKSPVSPVFLLDIPHEDQAGAVSSISAGVSSSASQKSTVGFSGFTRRRTIGSGRAAKLASDASWIKVRSRREDQLSQFSEIVTKTMGESKCAKLEASPSTRRRSEGALVLSASRERMKSARGQKFSDGNYCEESPPLLRHSEPDHDRSKLDPSATDSDRKSTTLAFARWRKQSIVTHRRQLAKTRGISDDSWWRTKN